MSRRIAMHGPSATLENKYCNAFTGLRGRSLNADHVEQEERRLEHSSKDESSLVQALAKENQMLREQLLQSHTRLESVMATLAAQSKAMLDSLQHAVPPLKSPDDGPEHDSSRDQASSSTSHNLSDNTISNAALNAEAVLHSIDNDTLRRWPAGGSATAPSRCLDILTGPHAQTEPHQPMDATGVSTMGFTPGSLDVALQHFSPLALPHQSFAGSQAAVGYPSLTSKPPYDVGLSFHATNSPYSDHLLVLEDILRARWDISRKPPNFALDPNGLTRPLMVSWYATTKTYLAIVDLVVWQLCPNSQTYENLATYFCPTHLQISSVYPKVINFCPFPTLRDKLILAYSTDPNLDQVILDIAFAYVVEARHCDIIRGGADSPIYIRVWDLFLAAQKANSEAEATDGVENVIKLPAPSLGKLFTDSRYASLCFKALGMDQGFSNYKLDPGFFHQYPDLYEPGCDVIAHGNLIAPSYRQPRLPAPKAPDKGLVELYSHLATVVFEDTGRPFRQPSPPHFSGIDLAFPTFF
ncbi:hypothetical protein DL767_009488 [Monosporascus sp. MG133]|nr:hypothetical protein DL767_009488 [Monosporascus sp. MG133]